MRCKHGIDSPEICCVYCKSQPKLPEISSTPRPRVCHQCHKPVESAYVAEDGKRHRRMCSLACYETWQEAENLKVRGRNSEEANRKRSEALKRYWTPERRAEQAILGRQRDISALIKGNEQYWTSERRAEKSVQMRNWHKSH